MKKIIIIFIMIFVIYSCYNDRGNYDYIQVREIKIDSIKSSYKKIAYIDYLKIEPFITDAKETDDLEYLWLLYTPKQRKDIRDYDIDTLSKDRDLNYLVALSPGDYKIRYMIKNKSNENLTFFAETSLRVVTKFSEGFYILKETEDGNTDIDMINKEDIEFLNLISKSTGKSMQGKPLSFAIYPEYSYLDKTKGKYAVANFLIPITDKGELMMFKIEDMTKLREHKDLFFSSAPEEKPYFFYPGKYYFGYVSSKGHYNNYQVPAWNMLSSGYFGYIDMIQEDNLGYKMFSSAIIFDYHSLFFDTKNGRFLSLDYNSGFHLFKDEEKELKPSGIQDKILFLGGGKIGVEYYAFSLFKKNNSDKKLLYYLSKLEFTKYSNPISAKREISPNLKLNEASLFTTNRLTARMLYYMADNKLYSYDYEAELEQEMNFEGLPTDEIITYINNIFWTDGGKERFDYLVIGTYLNGNYNIYMYDMVGGLPYGRFKRKLSGRGKVHKVQYMHPTIKNANRNNYSIHF